MLINYSADLPVWSAFSLADRTNGRAIGTVASVVICGVMYCG